MALLETYYDFKYLLVTFLLFGISVSDFVLYPYMSLDIVDAINGFGNTTAISNSCALALNATIACEPRLQYMIGSFASFNDSATSAILCSQTCRSSLNTYHNTVNSACGSVDVFDGVPATWRGDQIRDYLNVMCATDSDSGEYCVDVRQQQFNTHSGIALLDLPTDVLCSECQIEIWRALQGSPYNGYEENVALKWAAVQQKCGTAYPTTVQTANLTLPEIPNDETETTCASGLTYSVQLGDTCHSIALGKSVSEGSIWALNNLKSDCSLIIAGQQLCLPHVCDTITTSINTTCYGIAVESNVGYSAFLNWNPTIDTACSNLGPNSTVVCISSPYEIWNNTEIPGAAPTKTADWAFSTAPAPAPTAFRTTLQCGNWYQCVLEDDCARISLQYSLSLELFKQLNPSINELCSNLLPGLAYCVLPTVDWDAEDNGTAPDNSTTVAPPAPTGSGTTGQCYIWSVPKIGDTCALIAASYGISFATLRFWNPSLDEECTNLSLDVAYCVRGAVFPTGTMVSTITSSSTGGVSTSSISHSSTTAAPTCGKTYTVVGGDYCWKIATDAGLSVEQLISLNPSLGTDCEIDIGQLLCVAPPGTTSSRSSTPTTTARQTTTAAPTCGATYIVVSGDYCWKIANDAGLTVNQLIALNPSLDADCSINLGQVLCIAAPGNSTPATTAQSTPTPSSCAKRYTVVSGDYCWEIFTDNGLSESQFRVLNPSLNADCELAIGQLLCVG